jgi:sugar lactone lactonase YvrE
MRRTSTRLCALLAAAGLASSLVAAAPATARVTGPGVISTVAGGPGRGPAPAVAQDVGAVAAGPAGDVYVGDSRGVVRRLTSGTSWETVTAGTATQNLLSGPRNRVAATVAPLDSVDGLAVDSAGNVVIADGLDFLIWVVAARAGTFYGQAMKAGFIYSIAGTGSFGYSGDGGPATSAKLGGPAGLAFDPSGNLLIADSLDSVVRVVAARAGRFYGQAMKAGHIYTIAGTGTAGYSGDGGPGTSAQLSGPNGVTADQDGNAVVADTGNSRIRVVAAQSGTFYGQAMTAGDIYTIAGDGERNLTGDGGPAAAAELRLPGGLTTDSAGNLVIADTGNQRIRVIAAQSGTFYGRTMTGGDIYSIGGADGQPDVGSAQGVAVDSAGNVIVADGLLVRVMAESSGRFYGQTMTAGDGYTVAGNGQLTSGSGGRAIDAQLGVPNGVAVSTRGTMIISESATAQIMAVATAAGTFYGQAMKAGDIYTIAGTGNTGFSGDGGPATAAKLDGPFGPATDAAGNVVFADRLNQRVRVVANTSGTFYGQAMAAGHIYTIAGNGTSGDTGNGGPATSAELSFPTGAGVDAHGNVLIADGSNNQIRAVAASTGRFYGRAMTAGHIYTIAGNGASGYSGDGGPATAAALDVRAAPTVDSAGNVIFADDFNSVVRVVAAATGTFYGVAMKAGDIYTVAGTGNFGLASDGGLATSADLESPQATAVDHSGNLLIADFDTNRIRFVPSRSGTFYRRAVKAGHIYTMAGNGTGGFRGDGYLATSAWLLSPVGLAVTPAGGVLIDDSGNRRIREVAG